MSTRIKPLATFFQDYNVETNSPPENIGRIFNKNSKEQEYLLDLFRLLKLEKCLIPKIESERVSEPESLNLISFLGVKETEKIY